MKRSLYLLFTFIVFAVSSCSVPEIAYINDAQRDTAQTILQMYSSTIHSGDQLYIYVNSQTPLSAISFNQETKFPQQGNVVVTNDDPDRKVKADNRYITGYLVSEKGTIDFPILGEIYVKEITLDSLERKIQRMLREGDYLYDPMVTVSIMNFRVSVLGEVSYPQELHVKGERLTIFEALAMCGDLTISGCRDKVVVVREKAGKLVPIEIDLTKKSIFDSEVYYLQPNDIVYVEQNKRKRKVANRDKNIPPYIATAVAVLSLGLNIYRAWWIIAPRNLNQ